MDEPLFEERLWYPTWPILLLLAFVYAVVLVEGLVATTSTSDWIWGFAGATVVATLVGAVFKLTYRAIYTRIGTRTIEVGRGITIPRATLQEPRVVTGPELKQLRGTLRRGSSLLKLQPLIRGSITMPGCETAVTFTVSPPI